MRHFNGIFFLIVILVLSYFIKNSSFHKPDIRTKIRLIEESNEFGINAQNEIPNDSVFKNLPYFSFRFLFFSPGIVVSDFNKDGFMDFFVPNSNSNKKQFLFINQKGKKFKEESEKWGILPLESGALNISGAPVDFDNDGDMDLILTRLAGCTLLYRNEGKYFREVSKEYQLKDCTSSQMVLPYDFNSDGYLDLLFIKYWGKIERPSDINEKSFQVENYINAKNGGVNSLHLFNGKHFTNVTKKFDLNKSYWSFDATLLDLDGDNKMELYVANDFGPDQIYKLTKNKLINTTKNWKKLDRRNGMNVSQFYPLNEPFPRIFVSNIYLKNYMQRGNFLWKSNGKKLINQAKKVGTDNCGWSWGSVFGDFNLDGEEDFYVANGMITSKHDPSVNIETPAVMRSLPIDLFKNFDAFLHYSKRKNLNPSENAIREIIQGSVDKKTRSFSGNQKDCLFIKRGHSFVNISKKIEGLKKWDARGVAIIDVENDGLLDLIVSVQGGKLKLFKNYFLENSKGRKNWIGFFLKKNLNQSNSFGAKFILTQNEIVYRKVYLGGKSGFMTFSDPRIHFGLKTGEKVNLKIILPSGKVIKKDQLVTGKYYQINET